MFRETFRRCAKCGFPYFERCTMAILSLAEPPTCQEQRVFYRCLECGSVLSGDGEPLPWGDKRD